MLFPVMRALFGCGTLWVLAPGILLAQGYSPSEAPGRMTVPSGLAVDLVASEPLVRQPVALEFDDRGRAWVMQYLQYPNPAGLKRAKVDRYSRTTYDRVPEPPPRGPRGADRITILEDTDGDGRADRSHDFVDGLNLASGLAFGHGGVFVLQVPYLLFYADRDGDDRPDGDPEVLLTGFGMEDAHSVANSLTWGPDGWLYGCQGSTVTSNIRGIEFQQGVWRYHPLSHRFELFVEGGGNSWGLDFDRHGNLLYSTNYGGYALLHAVQGANYWKQFGKHGALHNPYAYGYFDHVPHQDLRGGHVTVGGIVYQGETLPAEFRDKFIAADLLGHAVHWHELTGRGSTFGARQLGDFLLANDTWFAPSDVTVGPDGAIYLCDWHDQRTGHPDPDADWDRTNGRVYRVRGTALKPKPIPPLATLTTAQLIELVGDRNAWLSRKARRVLADRRDPEAIFPLRRLTLESTDDSRALETFWALYVSGGLSDPFAAKLLEHRNPHIRWWTVRLLGDESRVTPDLAQRLIKLAEHDPSIAVRVQLAATATRLPAAQALPILAKLLARSEDASDPYQPLMLWWAVERHSVAAREAVLALTEEPAVRASPLAHATILPRLVRRYAAESSAAGYAACVRLLNATSEADRGRLLVALDEGLRDRTTAQGGSAGTLYADQATVSLSESTPRAQAGDLLPAPLTDLIDRSLAANRSDEQLLRLAARVDRPGARASAVAVAIDPAAKSEKRIAAIRILGEVQAKAASPELLKILASDAPGEVKRTALAALPQLGGDEVADRLLRIYPTLTPELRSQVVAALLSRQAWAGRLLEAVDRGHFAVADVALGPLRLVALHGDSRLDALVKKHWGSIQGGTPEERLAEMRRINNDLRAAKGDAASGHVLFLKHCGTCHRLFDEGTAIGPELTHANRKNLDELLATVVNPSAVIRKEFVSFVAQTSDGQVLTGLIVDQTPASVTLLSAKNERTTVPREKIETLSESTASLMPDDLLRTLKPQELRDLFAYLQSDPPAKATAATQTQQKP